MMTEVYRTSRRKPNFRRLMLASFETLQTMAPEKYWCIVEASSPAATWNLHTTKPRTLLPTYDEVVNLTGLL
jgi:hypothetical protein